MTHRRRLFQPREAFFSLLAQQHRRSDYEAMRSEVNVTTGSPTETQERREYSRIEPALGGGMTRRRTMMCSR